METVLEVREITPMTNWHESHIIIYNTLFTLANIQIGEPNIMSWRLKSMLFVHIIIFNVKSIVGMFCCVSTHREV